jgi:four helix bundle protein
MFEEGAQVRRSSKSVTALLIEGYRLRKHRNEFLHYLHRAAASADENLEHLDYLHETGSLGDKSVYTELRTEGKCVLLKLNTFILGVERNHSVPYYLRS